MHSFHTGLTVVIVNVFEDVKIRFGETLRCGMRNCEWR